MAEVIYPRQNANSERYDKPDIDAGEYDNRRQAPTVSRDALDCHNQRPLRAGSSVGLLHLGTHKVL